MHFYLLNSHVMDPLYEIINLNVGGHSFHILTSNLLKYPESLLGRLAACDTHENRLKLCDYYVNENNEYGFNKSPSIADSVLNFYRTGALHLPDGICAKQIEKELDYWHVPKGYVSLCCEHKLHSNDIPNGAFHFDTALNSPSVGSRKFTQFALDDDGTLMSDILTISSDNFAGKMCGNVRRKVWQFTENPLSSIGASIFSIISLSFIIATVIILILSSMEGFQVLDPESNITEVMPALEIADTICVTWFTLEYLLRLWAAPVKLAFMKEPMSIIDILAIFPFFFELFFKLMGVQSRFFGDMRKSLVVMRILRVLRILRVIRILKVARYSTGFQSMGQTLKRSWKELALLVMFMMTTNMMFSTAMYFIEVDDPRTDFHSIPDAMWWCVITMTTVGYGDVYPRTTVGKILAGMCSISGIILLAFPISVIVDNFNQTYHPEHGKRKESTLENGEVATLVPLGSPGAPKVHHIDGRIYIEMAPAAPKKRYTTMFS